MKQLLRATIQATSKSEIEGIVDPLRLAQIKETDSDPEIRVYSLGHAGEADLNLPHIGRTAMTWIQAAVQWVADKLLPGTAVFEQHDPTTNSHVGRVKIGEVVGKAVRHIGDHLNALAAIYILPQFKSRPLDFASIEADIEFMNNGVEAWPTAVNNVSGIALGNSDIASPGIPGATLLGAVQAYVQAFGSEFGGNKMNLSEVKQAVKELGLVPSQIFGVDDIMGDSKVEGRVQEEKKNVIAGSERIQRERDELKERVIKVENEKADSNKRLQQFQMNSKSGTLIDTIIAERNLDDKAKIFIRRNLKNLNTTATEEDSLKVELGKFVDDTHKEYQELAKDVFGVKDNSQQPNDQFKIRDEFLVDNQKQIEPSGREQTKIPATRQERIQVEMNPDINPLIPGGKAAKEALKT